MKAAVLLLTAVFFSPQTQSGIVTGSGGSPFLQMAIRDGHGINGEIVSSATVGQRITLDVVMQDTGLLAGLSLFLEIKWNLFSDLRLLRPWLLRSRRHEHSRSEHQHY